MRTLYARAMLWLIRPALELREAQKTALMATRVKDAFGAMQAATLKRVKTASLDVDALMRAAGYRPDGSWSPRVMACTLLDSERVVLDIGENSILLTHEEFTVLRTLVARPKGAGGNPTDWRL